MNTNETIKFIKDKEGENYKKLWEGFKKKYWDDIITIYVSYEKGYVTDKVANFMNEYVDKNIVDKKYGSK